MKEACDGGWMSDVGGEGGACDCDCGRDEVGGGERSSSASSEEMRASTSSSSSSDSIPASFAAAGFSEDVFAFSAFVF